jgi:predicted TPR repeat methyltransferase
MLARARQRNVYDELVKTELTSYLTGADDRFDVVLSADTLVYFGPLDEVVSAAASALRPSGRLAFTVEELVGAGYLLAPNGRYQHSRDYVQAVLTDAGLRPEIVSAELRLEAGEPVAGLVVLGTRER